jgi:very-short-patch-repair endonuclease
MRDKFYATPYKKTFATELRNNPTPAEEYLWKFLQKGQRKQNRFVRQKVILGWIVDFYTHDSRLAIELDGRQHSEPSAVKYDTIRTKALNSSGIYVLRFTNDDVFDNTEAVLDRIDSCLTIKGFFDPRRRKT